MTSVDRAGWARRWMCHLLVPSLCVVAIALLAADVAAAGSGDGQAVTSAQPPATQPTKQDAPPEGGGNPTAEELTRQIEELVRQAQAQAQAGEQQQPKPKPKPPTVQPQKPAAGQAQTPSPIPAPQAASSKGCGGSMSGKVDLTPPPADQPQPRYVCDEPEVEAPPSWGGGTAEFVFKIRNEGEGALNIRVKGG